MTYRGTWTNSAPFKVTTLPESRLSLRTYGQQLTLTYGTGPDHSIFDIYIGGSLWQSFDGYAAMAYEGPFGDVSALLA